MHDCQRPTLMRRRASFALASLRGNKPRFAPVIFALAVAGCGQSSGPTEAEQLAAQKATQQAAAQAAQKAAQQECIRLAYNHTAEAGSFDGVMDERFQRQDLANCPQDFVESFVASANTVHLLRKTRDEIFAHATREGQVQDAAGWATLRDVLNGKPSDDTPYSDWKSEGGELQQRAVRLLRQYEDDRAAVKLAAARHGLVPPPRQAEPSTSDAAPVPSTNEPIKLEPIRIGKLRLVPDGGERQDGSAAQ